MRRLFALLVLVPIVGAPLFAADDEETPRFPDKGSSVPGPYHVLNITGARAKRYHCLVCQNGLNPTAAIIIQPKMPADLDEDKKAEWMVNWVKENLADDAPLCKLFKKLDTVADKNPDAFMGVYAIFLAERDDDKKLNYQVPIVERLLKLSTALDMKAIIYGTGNTDEPKSRVKKDDKEEEFEIKPWFKDPKDFEIGVLLYDHYKVVEWHKYDSGKLTDKDVADIVKEFDGLVPYYARPGYRPKLKVPK